MTQRNEKNLVEARKKFYEDAVNQDNLLQIGDIAGKHVLNISKPISLGLKNLVT